MKDDIVFSLDIGTRTVIGIVGKYEDGILNILASETINHEKRAMYDGQIHDINSVVRVAKKVKENLESQLGFNLDKVAVAAAGRSLEISRSKVTIEVDSTREISRSIIKSAELAAIQKSEELLNENKDMKKKKYYCVGHTVVEYFLDDISIENLEGHRGEEITVDIIATFLPHTVIDSLNTVMDRLNLKIINMTLEPIAAINIAVKKDLRLLNIVLVDIGAGTSDIAITKEGTISSYAMVPLAGDEITEKLVKTYLLDYDTAEDLKISLNSSNEHEFKDIIGMTHKLSTEEVLEKIDETIKTLAREISEKILTLNEGSPSVAFLIGGGSQIPRLSKYMAEFLDIPEERVDIKDTSLIENVTGIDKDIKGPDAITPVGIALMSIESNYKDFIEVTINQEKIKIFNIDKAKVTDALLLTDFNPRNLVSKRGQALRYYINGVEKSVLGKLGEPAKIYLNNELASLENRIKTQDEIVIEYATIGEEAEVNLFDIIDVEKHVYLNGEQYKLISEVYLNQEKVVKDTKLKQDDKIKTIEILTVRNLLNNLDIKSDGLVIYKDEKKISLDYNLQDQDILTTNYEYQRKYTSPDEEETVKEIKTINLSINGKEESINYKKENFQFVDVFEHIDFDLNEVKGNLVLKVNGLEAKYLQNLKDGDNLEIFWDS